MNAFSDKNSLTFHYTDTVSRLDDAGDLPVPANRGLFARMATALRTVAELPHRWAVINELNLLSDRELADVGLQRSDLGRVFDSRFVAERELVNLAR